MKRWKNAIVVVCAIVMLAVPEVRAEIKLPHVISDHMVLQRDMALPIWGWAEPGEAVTVKLGKQTVQAKADAKGKWMVKLAAMPAGGPLEMTVAGTNTITVKDILVGEVWVGSGQSNMAMSVAGCTDAKKDIAAAKFPNIRLFTCPRRPSGQPESDINAAWRVCSPGTVAYFSAAAYFFGREIHKELKVPVGLVNTSWGGTRIEPWTPIEGFEAVPKLASHVKRVKDANATYRKMLTERLGDMRAWVEDAAKALETGERIPNMPNVKHSLNSHGRETGLYNGMVAPLVPFAIRGALWYQGEANRYDGMHYFEKMKGLIAGWRKVWGQGDFPFLFVQLAPYRYGGDPAALARCWEGQTATLSVPNTGMAVTNDITTLGNIHPPNKQDVGKRLALWALAKTYGKDGLVYSGPLYKSSKVEGNKIRISFDHVGSGLASRDGKPLNWFQIAGADKKFVDAQAKIDGATVLVWSDQVAKPAAVRLGWNQEAEPNLMNKEKLPASSFRTDKW